MAFNKDNLLIVDVLSGVMLDKTDGNILFVVNDIASPSLELGGEKVYADDRLGFHIAAFDRQKTATFSGENGTFSLGVLAAQTGARKKVGSDSAKLIVPFKEYVAVGSQESITLKHTPIEGSVAIARLDTGREFVESLDLGTQAGATTGVLSGTTLTLPTGLAAGDYIGVFYEYESADAVTVVDTMYGKSISGVFRLEVLFADKCDQATQYYGYIVFPSAVMDNNATMNLTTEDNHPFSIEAMVDYCSADQELFHIVVPGEEK